MEIGGENEVYNIAGGCEQRNIDVIKKIIKSFDKSLDPDDIISFSEDRLGQDTRYAVNDDKLRALGWSPEALFDEKLEGIVESFAETFRW